MDLARGLLKVFGIDSARDLNRLRMLVTIGRAFIERSILITARYQSQVL